MGVDDPLGVVGRPPTEPSEDPGISEVAPAADPATIGADPVIELPPAPDLPAPPPPAAVRDEVAILRDAVAGDAEAVRILLDVHFPTVYGFVRARLGGREHAVEDVLQETLEEAVRSAKTFRGDAALATWLCTIARRRLARFYERERKAEETGRILDVVPDHVEDALDRKDEVVRALGSLAFSQRQALVFKYLDDLSVEQVAEQMGRTPVQVQSLLQRGREALKKELDRVRG
jgi:RNA polymerase sigma-70 factor (ECF subfamily)